MRTRLVAYSQNRGALHHGTPLSGVCRTRLPVLQGQRNEPRFQAFPMRAVSEMVIERDALKWPWKFLPPLVACRCFKLPTQQPAKVRLGLGHLSNMRSGKATSKDSMATKAMA